MPTRPRLEVARITPVPGKGLSLHLEFSHASAQREAYEAALLRQGVRVFSEADSRKDTLRLDVGVASREQAGQVAAMLQKATGFRLRKLRLEACAATDEDNPDGPADVMVDVRVRPDRSDEANIAGLLSADILQRNVGRQYGIVESEHDRHFQIHDKSSEAPNVTAAVLRAEKLKRRLEGEYGIGARLGAVRLVDMFHDTVQAGRGRNAVHIRLQGGSERDIDRLLASVRRKYRGGFTEMQRDTGKHEVVLGTSYAHVPDLAQVVSFLHIGLNCELPVRIEVGAQQNQQGFHPSLTISASDDAKHRGLLGTAMAHYISLLVPAKHRVEGENGTRALVLEQTCPDANEAVRWAMGLRKRVDEKLAVSRNGLPGH